MKSGISRFSLEGKKAVVTGGAGLIGKELVKGLAELGATTILAEIDQDRGRTAAGALKAGNLDVIYRRLDVAKKKSVSNLIDSIDKKYGRIDIWVNAAYPKTRDWGVKFNDVRNASWRKNIDMHLSGYFICCKEIAEYMRKQRSGSIINIASTYGIVGPEFSIYENTKMTMPAAYSAIKGGIINFTRFLASYYGKYNVRVNCVSPGGVYERQPKVFVRKYVAKTPLKRMAKTTDISAGVVYLASDAAEYVTGHNLVIDGGWTII